MCAILQLVSAPLNPKLISISRDTLLAKTLIRLTLQKLEISASSMGHYARKKFSFLAVNKVLERVDEQ